MNVPFTWFSYSLSGHDYAVAKPSPVIMLGYDLCWFKGNFPLAW